MPPHARSRSTANAIEVRAAADELAKRIAEFLRADAVIDRERNLDIESRDKRALARTACAHALAAYLRTV